MSIAPMHRDTCGESPMIPPHLLTAILAKLKTQRARINEERNTPQDAWAGIDALAKSMEAAK
jgi:hypothetical protein